MLSAGAEVVFIYDTVWFTRDRLEMRQLKNDTNTEKEKSRMYNLIFSLEFFLSY